MPPHGTAIASGRYWRSGHLPRRYPCFPFCLPAIGASRETASKAGRDFLSFTVADTTTTGDAGATAFFGVGDVGAGTAGGDGRTGMATATGLVARTAIGLVEGWRKYLPPRQRP